MIIDDDDTITLSSGRKLYANRGIVGLGVGRDGASGLVFGGYDQGITSNAAADGRQRFCDMSIDAIDAIDAIVDDDERREIALFMMEAWARWGFGK